MKIRRTCTADGCTKPRENRSALLCQAHRRRLSRTGSLGTAPVRGWRMDAPGYSRAHKLITAAMGPACNYLCGCGDIAYSWAYLKDDPCELVWDKTGYRYSVDPDHYVPMCPSCHTRFDHGSTPVWLMERDLGLVAS